MVPLEDVETVVDEVVRDVDDRIDSDAVELWFQCTHRDMLTLGRKTPKLGTCFTISESMDTSTLQRNIKWRTNKR